MYFEQAIDYSKEEFDNHLLRLRTLYYNNVPEVSDDEYDALLQLYKNKFNIEYISVGAPLENSKKNIKLPRYMQSLDKIKNTDEKSFKNWLKKYPGPYVISDKLDGISCGMWGKKTFTQGNGFIGVDISHLNNILGNKNINGLPRGEIVISKKLFNEKYKNKYSNPRNMVSGVVGKKNKSSISNDLSFYAYNWSPENKENPLSPFNQFKFLENYFKVPFYTRVPEISIDFLQNLYLKRKQEAEYDIDGLVVYNDEWEDIKNGELCPKNAFAFKMDGQIATTTIKNIEWEVSKHGKLKPVAHFNEVNLGVNINKSTAFSAKFVVNNQLGPGSVITIVRSGEVIPYIKNVVEPTKAQLPDFPWRWCKTKEMRLVKNTINIPPYSSIQNIDGQYYYVWDKISDVDIEIINNDDFHTKRMDTQKIIHFFKTLGAKHIGEETIIKLINNGYDTLNKILLINKDDVLKIDGFKEKSSERLVLSIQSSVKDISLAKLVSATGILGEGVAEKKFQSILDLYPDFLDMTKNMNVEEIENMIKSVGGFDKKALVIALNINNLRKFLNDHSQISLKKTEKQNINNNSLLLGKTVVFTGFRNSDLEEKIKSLGGKVSSSVSKNTHYLIKAGLDTSTKEVKAMNLKTVEILPLEDFLKKFIN